VFADAGEEATQMWRDRDPYRDHQYVPDTFWLVAAALLFAACGLMWLIGQVAAILFGPHHQHLPVRLVDMLGVLLRLPGTWDDPAQAWPPTSRPLLPGPVGMYAAAVVTFWLPAFAYGLLLRLLSPRARRRCRQHGAKWASWWQLRRLLVFGPRRGRIILGRRDRIRDRLLGRLYLAVEGCHSVLAFGPPGSFKTHGLVIPAILEWQGNLVTTSIKPDVLRATCAHRASLGAVWVYDPLGLSGVPGARWTPLAHCTTYADARRIGRMLADAADIGGHRAEDANYWQLLGAKLLSVLLFAAAGTGRSMADVARWVDVQDVDDVAQALMEIGNQQALDAWAACSSRPDNTMGSVYGTAETLLDVFGDPVIAASAEGCDLDLDQLLTGANNTLYLYAPASEQERLRPLFELLVSRRRPGWSAAGLTRTGPGTGRHGPRAHHGRPRGRRALRGRRPARRGCPARRAGGARSATAGRSRGGGRHPEPLGRRGPRGPSRRSSWQVEYPGGQARTSRAMASVASLTIASASRSPAAMPSRTQWRRCPSSRVTATPLSALSTALIWVRTSMQ
jgi:Type IV secretory system Conjugative DNA transfer